MCGGRGWRRGGPADKFDPADARAGIVKINPDTSRHDRPPAVRSADSAVRRAKRRGYLHYLQNESPPPEAAAPSRKPTRAIIYRSRSSLLFLRRVSTYVFYSGEGVYR